MNAKIQLDLIEESLTECKLRATDLGLDFKLITLNGPAGGNPLVELYGPKSLLIEFITWTHGQDEQPLKWLIEEHFKLL